MIGRRRSKEAWRARGAPCYKQFALWHGGSGELMLTVRVSSLPGRRRVPDVTNCWETTGRYLSTGPD